MEYIKGGVYDIRCRNFNVGVFDGNRGFIGVREKFGREYLFTEFLPPGAFGTVVHVGEMRCRVPEGIEITESGGSVCQCGAPAHWLGPPAPAAWRCEGPCKDEDVRSFWSGNPALFEFLSNLED